MQTIEQSSLKKKRKFLIVEDMDDIANSVFMWSKIKGLDPVISPNRDDATKRLSKHSVDVILLDYRMPGMPADEFVSFVRKSHPKATLILTTGDKNAYEIASSLGIGYVLPKPFHLDDLAAIIRRAADAHIPF